MRPSHDPSFLSAFQFLFVFWVQNCKWLGPLIMKGYQVATPVWLTIDPYTLTNFVSGSLTNGFIIDSFQTSNTSNHCANSKKMCSISISNL